MQQTQNIPGYTGFKPSEEPFMSAAYKKETGGNKIPGYAGYVPGVKSENVFGESYGKTSGLSGNGQIQRGFDQPADDKFKSMAKASYSNQRELYQTMQQQKNNPPQKGPSVDDIPRNVQAKFFGIEEHDQDRWTQNEKFQQAALTFYGDGSKLQEVYGRRGESFDQAAAKFYGSDTVVKLQDPNKITLSYQEARQVAYQQQ
ncbi:UNKNOWN [Stylonychia lemnae]|uniref:Uncharacterized protein n=1 Tax=Stylonychia lemnae TaxID=5949 RepID=A0A078APC0_STYLE|nr:UNKNOWN [Stylonychia lemnae]|eukprot:CDW82803.1 UNKNOWN [Stylonychia lemnae]